MAYPSSSGWRPAHPKVWARLLGLCACIALVPAACKSSEGGSSAPAGAAPPPVPVVVAEVEQRTVPIELDAIAHVEASSTVELTSQVSGKLEKVHFNEGDEVKKGQLLFNIEAQPFRAALAEAQAQVQRDKALAAQAELDSQRADSLATEGLGTTQEKERASSNSVALSASLSAHQAAVQASMLELAHTEIRSPIDGRAGTLLVHEGNVVKANGDSPLVVLRCVKPVYVRFTLPEQYLPQIRERMAGTGVQVSVTALGSSKPPLSGQLTFVDNTVDTATGTIGLKAELPNLDEALWPGQQVNVQVNLGEEPNAVRLPEAAVQAGQEGPYAYVINADNKAELRHLSVTRTVDHWSVVSSGVKPGEKVAVEGLVRLAPGAAVKVTEPPPTPAPNRAASTAPGSP